MFCREGFFLLLSYPYVVVTYVVSECEIFSRPPFRINFKFFRMDKFGCSLMKNGVDEERRFS